MAQASLKRIQLVRETVGKVTRIISETKNVMVTQAGSEAFVKRDKNGNPTQINIPSIADDASDAYLDAIQGFMDKECAEVLFVDYNTRRKVEAEEDEELSNIFKLVEECFCERSMRMKYEGSKTNLTKVSDIYIERIVRPKLAEAITNGASEAEIFKLIAPSFFRAQAGQMSFAGFAREMEFDKLIPNLYRELADILEEELPKVSSSEEALKLAELIRSIFEKKRNQPKNNQNQQRQQQQPQMKPQASGKGKGKPQPGGKGKPKKSDASEGESEEEEQKSSGAGSDDPSEEESEEKDKSKPEDGEDEADGGSDSEDGEGEDESEGSSSDDSEEGEDGEDASDELGGDAETDEWIEDNEEHEGSGESEMSIDDLAWENVTFGKNSFVGDMSQFIKKASEESLKKNPEEAYVPYTKDWDLIKPYEINPKHDYSGTIKEIEDRIHPMVGPLKKQIQAAYFVMNRSFYVPGKRSGRINPNGLARLSYNDDRVFRQKEEHKTQEVAISIVVDQSGSMHGSKTHTSVCGAYAIAEVLHQLGISFEIIGFTTGSGNEKARDLDTMMRTQGAQMSGYGSKGGYSRVGPIHIYEYKRFDEIFSSQQRKRLAHLYQFQEYMNSNVDGESLEYAAARLLRRPEPGKSMIVLSDGAPAGPGNSYAFHHHLKRVVKQLQNDLHINVVGIGIQTETVADYYPKHILVRDVKDLPEQMLKSLKNEILRKA